MRIQRHFVLGLLGVLCWAIGGSQSKAVVDQQPAASQVDSKSVAQQRIDLGLGLGDALIHDHHEHHEHIIEHHEHHHEHHDPGYWKKKVTWKEGWKKIWNPAKKQIWNPSWKKIWKPAKKQIWVPEKKLEWKEGWKQYWKPAKKEIWTDKLEWKEAWKQIWVPGWKEIWVPGWKKIWKPVVISEWFPSPDHHDHHHHHEHGFDWDRKDAGVTATKTADGKDKVVWKRDDTNAAGKPTFLQPVASADFQAKSLEAAKSPVAAPAASVAATSQSFKFPGA
ncbi:uncharacterized protein LOC108036234 isoform X2 [Drosophila biarmipes]|uniref:uncharacterized protein LOC108036234 isoform X2 n=1 Tax=Drosophila biarmipes TaxID=125945 RepID=UPI0021CD1141|nr:uncharacterized protein LOC108036234 isoform X2 [Drosophila biarmipes]